MSKTTETKNLTYVMNLTEGILTVRKGEKNGKDKFEIAKLCPAYAKLPSAEKSHDRRMMMHGFKQKLVDQISGLKKALGRDVGIKDAEESMREVFDNMILGVEHWNFKRESNGKLSAKTTALRKIDEKVTANEIDEARAVEMRAVIEEVYAA